MEMFNENKEVKAGFLIVKTYASLWSKYSPKYELEKDFYGFPRKDLKPSEQKIQYRGLDRDALEGYKDSDILAEIRMDELVKEGKCIDGFLFDLKTVKDIYVWLDTRANEYEIIWARIAGSGIIPPSGYRSIGFEPTYFVSDHFSASSDCMIIPRWHGTDREGKLFKEHFEKLNHYGLFKTPTDAKLFLDYYLSFDWTETGEYEIAEIYIQSEANNQQPATNN